jgi:geranylgeranyl diphosphate synthase type II
LIKAALTKKQLLLQFYSYFINKMIYSIRDLENRINDAIKKIPLDLSPQALYDPIRYVLSSDGKRLRPILTLMATNLFSDDVSLSLSPAVGIEIFHNFTLLHDDLMDRADMRRGNPTVHQLWGNNAAILSGDAMLIQAYTYIADVPLHLLPDVLSLFSKTAMEVCQGQQYDMDFEKRRDVTEAEYMEMIRLKTAVLIACSLKIGAMLGKASSLDSDLLYQFGIHIGMAFQLKDDLLDVYGDTKTFGKNIGGDIVCNKKTFLLIKALENSNASQRKELDKWLTAKDVDSTTKINAVKNIYDELNLKAISENLIEKYYLSALDCFSNLPVASARKNELLVLVDNLMQRHK